MLAKTIQLNISNQPGAENMNNKRKLSGEGEADLCMMIGSKIFPLHRSNCTKSRLITEGIEPSDKFFLLDDCNINKKMVERTLQLFYGCPLSLETQKELVQALTIIQYLEIEDAIFQAQEQLLAIFHQCDLFFVLNLAYLHQMRRLYIQCFEQLQKDGFQQMLYNKFDLINSDFKLFQVVLHTHKNLQSKGKVIGVSVEEVEEIIKLYCAANHYNQETFHQLLNRYGKLKEIGSKHEKTEAEKKKKQVEDSEPLPLAELARKQGIVSDIYEAKQEEDCKPYQQKKKNQQERQEHQNNDITKQNPNIFPFKTITRQSVDKLSDPASPVAKKQNTKKMALGIDYLGVQHLTFPKQKTLNRSINIEDQFQANENEENFQAIQEEDADIFQMKISRMLDRYENAYKQHNKNFQLMKENYGMKSVMMNEQKQRNDNKNLFVASRRDSQMGKKIDNQVAPFFQ